MVKALPFNAGGVGSISGQRAKIPRLTAKKKKKKKKIEQKQNYNKFKCKDF